MKNKTTKKGVWIPLRRKGAKNVCIFLVSGKTFTFKDVTILQNNETVLVFKYAAMSDGLSKTATFSKAHVAGYSEHSS